MDQTCYRFSTNARKALADPALQRALANVKTGFPAKRAAALAQLPEYPNLRRRAREIKDEVIGHLDSYLVRFEEQVTRQGGHVHWARDAEEACRLVVEICRAQHARLVTKGKSMVTEEIGLNEALQAAGMETVETDLGEYILQLRGEHPSHIIAPAIHLNREQVAETFHANHRQYGFHRRLEEPADLLQEARQVLRRKFLSADVGITGANFCIAETGSTVIVTNEGNGDLTQLLPKVHVVVTGIEKVLPTLDDLAVFLRLLARSATGQASTVYNTLSTGPRRTGDPDGPEAFHVVLVDNGRSDMVGGPFQDMLRCIRCGACMNHCPVYGAVGGHAYGWIYPGPMGAVLTPQLIGLAQARPLVEASTLCGRCAEVCPVEIPLPDLLRRWRERAFDEGLMPATQRWGLGAWAALARRPRLYGWLTGFAARWLRHLAGTEGRLSRLPLAGGWTASRDLPAPEGRTFREQWLEKRKKPE